MSDVILTFSDGTDNYFARQQVFNRIAGPQPAQRGDASVSPLFSPSGLIYRYVLQSPDRSPMELKTIEDWIDRAANTNRFRAWRTTPAWAAAPCNIRCCSIRSRSPAVGLSVPQVESALAANNGNAGGGFYSQGGQFYYVRGLGRLDTLEDIGNVVLAVHNGTPILVKDVGAGGDRHRARAWASSAMRIRTTPSKGSS